MGDVAYRQRFRRGAASADLISEAARDVLAELGRPGSEATGAADRAGFDPARLTDARIKVAEGEQGVEPVLTSVVVSIAASVGAKVVESLWTDVLLPRIRRRLGADALGPPIPDPRPPDPHQRDPHLSDKDG
jgi:hypothetical protein